MLKTQAESKGRSFPCACFLDGDPPGRAFRSPDDRSSRPAPLVHSAISVNQMVTSFIQSDSHIAWKMVLEVYSRVEGWMAG
jgi:hypothetical protein